jgi:hypothetical protein
MKFYPTNISGEIYRLDNFYPPTTEHKIFPQVTFPVGQYASNVEYAIFRSYVSFNTSLPVGVSVLSLVLNVAVETDVSLTNFNLRVYSGKSQWSNTTNCNWASCSTDEGVIFNTNNLMLNHYYWYSLKTNSINGNGTTQFRLKSDNEGITPSSAEYVWLYAWNDTVYKPFLEVQYSIPSVTPPSPPTNLNILFMNQALGQALGVDNFVGGLILSFALIFGFVILPLAIFKAPLVAYATLIAGAMGIFTALGWLPIWCILIEVMILVGTFAGWLGGVFGGKGE